jgi:hypothetical protein
MKCLWTKIACNVKSPRFVDVKTRKKFLDKKKKRNGPAIKWMNKNINDEMFIDQTMWTKYRISDYYFPLILLKKFTTNTVAYVCLPRVLILRNSSFCLQGQFIRFFI